MKPGSIWKISVVTTMEAEDAVSDLLRTIFSQPPSSYTDADSGVTSVSVYLESKVRQPVQTRRAVLRGVSRIRDCGLDVGAGKVSVRKIRREDWAESWKRHFKPIELGNQLLVKPSWSQRRAKPDQAVVVLDPGLSFGTGQHPTTAFCLAELVRRRKITESQSFLDIGTGSGILAISAAKLGYSPVRAFDFDPESVRVVRTNARNNGVVRQIQLEQADVTKLAVREGRRYDVICANLISTLLIAEARRIIGVLDAGGVLVLAGILKSEFSEVQRVYDRCGLRLIASKSQNEWRSGTFVRSPR